ncbi:DUF2339 domain-containing protein [Flavobacterium sp. NKUCC04_CG]|uniref:DUF2339 domain-containing protein n=1 Tax=Flavobacterium sp. NKUCC04_CG TaxID=2842121 RepID=UPI001C5AC9C8|nr:DUF2339 domain-containing protein [Flavobacterium sp. NKUCC04_CG]MBW3519465.1 DUF2339 domain-containing protein [Flavobacterium sp. NKUCC04_CG]
MEGFVFLMIIVFIAIIVLFVVGLLKILSTASKMDDLFLKLTAVEVELQKLRKHLVNAPAMEAEGSIISKDLIPLDEKQLEDSIQHPPIPIITVNPLADVITKAVPISELEEKELGQLPIIGRTTIATADELESLATVESEGPVASAVQSGPIRTVQMPRKKSALERFLSDNLLTKIGIVTFVLGIGFFVKYAIDQDWINEVGRVGIGVLTGALMIGVAHKLRKSLSVFSSLLVGGGIAVFYITITLAFREYELFNQTVAFLILILITVFSVALSLFYNRKELAVFSLLGGFMAPLMVSTGIGNYVVLFSYIFILNSGMLYLSYKKNWVIIGYITFVLTVIFKMTWIGNGFVDQYFGASLFAILFFMQFYMVALVNMVKGKRIVSHIVLIILNNMVFTAVFLYLFDDYAGGNWKGLIVMCFALVNAAVLVYLRKQQKINSLYIYAISGIVVSLITLAIPIQLNGYFITLFWAAEMVVLLLLYFKSKFKIFYTGFLVVSMLALLSYVIDISVLNQEQYATLIFNKVFITGLVVFVAFYVTQFLLKRNNIQTFVTRSFTYILRILGFVVPLLELSKELHFLEDGKTIDSFESLVYLVYIITYAAIVFWISTKSLLNFVINWMVLGISILVLGGLMAEFRIAVFVYQLLGVSYFFILFLAIPGLVALLMFLYKNPAYGKAPKVVRWLLPVFSLILLCYYIDNTTLLINGWKGIMTNKEYNAVLIASHILFYPIVWGALALFLTYLGIKLQHIFLRQIGLALLGLTIVKFYVLDVWSMSEGGKVFSFVLLGLIILIVAFLLNRIKGILGQREPHDVIESEETEDGNL